MEKLETTETFILNRDYKHIMNLIERVKNGDNSAMEYINLYFYSVIKSHVNSWGDILGYHHIDDIQSVAYCAVIEATHQYKGNSSKLYFKYVNNRIKSRVINYIKGEAKHLDKLIKFQDNDEYHYFLSNISDSFNYESYCICNILLMELYENLNTNEQNLFNLILCKMLNDKAMAKHLGISNDCLRQRKSSLKAKIEQYLKPGSNY